MLDMKAVEALGVDTSAGLACCADDPEFYEEMLAEYVKESKTNVTDLQRFFEARDFDNYRIKAHSVKSTSRMIGASALAETAYGLELAGKERDETKIAAAHEPFLSAYSSFAERLRELVK